MSHKKDKLNLPFPSRNTSPVTLKDVADAAGVSIATASYSLNNVGSIGPATRKKIIEIAELLGYQPNHFAKAMRTGKTRIIGLVVPDLNNPFFSQLMQAVIITARQLSYEVIISNSLGDPITEKNCINALSNQGIDGLIWFPINETKSANINVPIQTILIDRKIDKYDCITADCEFGGELAAKYLIENGHKKIALINGPLSIKSSRDRANGARSFLIKSNTLVWEYESDYTYDIDEDLVKLISNQSVSAVIVGADIIAIGVMRAASRKGISIPKKLSIIGFDNIPWAELCTPSLTTINYPVTEIGNEAVVSLLRRMSSPSDPFRNTQFPTTLVERQSVLRLKM
jgi:LacI family transcriptional regulator